MSLSGKRTLITGAGSGIGRDTARRFSAAGAHVVAVDLDGGALDALRQELPEITAVVADISAPADVERAVSAAGGPLDVLCNNAGLMDRMRLVDETTLEDWERVFAVNVTGPFLLCQRALPAMVAAGGGAIVNVASIASVRGGRAGAAYTSSKHALLGLTRSIAVTYGAQGIRCNSICPGGIRGGAKGAHPAGAALSERGTALIRGRDRLRPEEGTADEIATIVAFLASDAASRINGAEIVADGAAIAF